MYRKMKEINDMTEEQYTMARTFWTRKDSTQRKMDPDALYEWIGRFLSCHRVLALATGTGDYIRCTPLEYTWHDDALWIFTEGGLKFKGLKNNRNIAAAIFDTTADFGTLKSLQIEGTAEIAELFSEEYKAAAAFRKIPLEMLKKLPEPMWLLKITPTEITCLNSEFKKEGFGSRQIWRQPQEM